MRKKLYSNKVNTPRHLRGSNTHGYVLLQEYKTKQRIFFFFFTASMSHASDIEKKTFSWWQQPDRTVEGQAQGLSSMWVTM